MFESHVQEPIPLRDLRQDARACGPLLPMTLARFMVKPSREIDESASDVVLLRHGPMTSSFDQLWSAMLSCLSRPADGDGRVPGEGWLHGTVDAAESHKVSTDNAGTFQRWQGRGGD